LVSVFVSVLVSELVLELSDAELLLAPPPELFLLDP